MIKPVSPRERMMFSTVLLEVETHNGARGTGTAFRFQFKLDGKYPISTLITNKHVIEGAAKGRFVMHTADVEGEVARPSGGFHEVVLDNMESHWIHHPSSSVDLCALWLDPIRKEAEDSGTPLFDPTLDESMIWSDERLETLDAVEEVTMFGYPNALWDHKNNLPLLRRGVTATHPAIDFCGDSTTVIDIACFPGSSGSPVMWIDDGTGRPFKGGSCVISGGGMKIVLLGVLFAGPVYRSFGEVVTEPVPTSCARTVNDQMINLGYIVKAKELFGLRDHIYSEFRSVIEQTIGENQPASLGDTLDTNLA